MSVVSARRKAFTVVNQQPSGHDATRHRADTRIEASAWWEHRVADRVQEPAWRLHVHRLKMIAVQMRQSLKAVCRTDTHKDFRKLPDRLVNCDGNRHVLTRFKSSSLDWKTTRPCIGLQRSVSRLVPSTAVALAACPFGRLPLSRAATHSPDRLTNAIHAGRLSFHLIACFSTAATVVEPGGFCIEASVTGIRPPNAKPGALLNPRPRWVRCPRYFPRLPLNRLSLIFPLGCSLTHTEHKWAAAAR